MNQHSLFPVVAQKELREYAAKIVMDKIGTLLMRINSNESGRILETVIQLLPVDAFRTMAALCLGNESDDVTRNFILEFVTRIANKLGLDFDSTNPINEAAGAAMVIINCEALRRKGHMEYAAPNDVFSATPKYVGYNKLTESGIQLLHEELLESPFNPKYLM